MKRKYRPNWEQGCDNCGQKPTIRASGLCGPCHFGTAEAVNGGWWDEGADDFDMEFVDEHIPES
jgi:hypothetical protein